MSRRWAWIVLAFCAACIGFAALWRRPIPGESILLALLTNDARIQKGMWTIGVVQVRHAVRLQLALWPAALALFACWWLLPDRIRIFLRERSFRLFIALACSSVIYLTLWRHGFEGPWSPITPLMTHPSSLPIFGHRLLWVWIADAIKYVVPALDYRQCFLLSQIPSVLLAVWMVGVWSALFVDRELQWIGQVLLTAILSLTLDYYTFYDVAIIFFFALSLYWLRKSRHTAFVITLGLATLNHENAVLLIPVAFLETLSNKRLCAVVTTSAVAVYFAVRTALQYFIPFRRHMDWGFWVNLYDPFAEPGILVISFGTLFFWYAAAASLWRSADPFLKRAAVIVPLLIGITFLVGQFHESRQFDAAIPVVIGFILRGVNETQNLLFSRAHKETIIRVTD